MSKSPWLQLFPSVGLALAISFFPSEANVQDIPRTKPAAAAPAPVTPAPAPAPQPIQQSRSIQPSGVSKLALAVVQLGNLRCAEMADKVAKFVGRGTGEVVIVDRLAAQSSSDVVSATMIVPVDGGIYSSVDIVLAPTSNGCSTVYSATIHVAEKCEQAQKTLYGGLAFSQINDVPYRISSISDSARILSQDVATGCLLTKREIVR